MKLPLVIDNRGDVLVFRNKEDAEVSLEPIDVIHEEYVGTDAAGHPLRFAATMYPPVVRIACDDDRVDETALRDMLERFLKACRVSEEFYSGTSIDCLVAMASAYPHR